MKSKLLFTIYCLLFTVYCLLLAGCVKKEPEPPIVTPQKEGGKVVILEPPVGLADAFGEKTGEWVGMSLEDALITPTGWAGDCNDDPAHISSIKTLYHYYNQDYTQDGAGTYFLVIGVEQPDSCKYVTIGIKAADYDDDIANLTSTVLPVDATGAIAGRVYGPEKLYPESGTQPAIQFRYRWYPLDPNDRVIKGKFTITVTVRDKAGNEAKRTFYVAVMDRYE